MSRNFFRTFLKQISMANSSFPSSRLFSFWLLAPGFCLLFSSCALFDDTQLQQQRAEIERLRSESARLKQEADALQQQTQREEQEREACNQAFYSFDAARKAGGDMEEAIAKYKEGLGLCPKDDVAHNELGEIYMRAGRKTEAVAEFEAALQINPNFSRAQRNLDSLQ